MAGLTEDQQIAFQRAASNHNLIITGQCGTGKTYLLRRIIQHLQSRKKVAVTSTTGMASKVLGFGATTLHHWSGIGDGRLTHFQLEAKFLKDDRFAAAKSRIENAEVLVIDEIGMLSETIFNKIEHICRLARGNNLVFGGLQVIGTGDFKQLAPVPNYRYHDPGSHVFNSNRFKLVFPHHVNLTTVVRQNEPELIQAINKLCDGRPDDNVEQFIKSLSRPLNDEAGVCRLFGTKFDAEFMNQIMLDELPGDAVTYKSRDEGNTRLLHNCDADKHLSVKVGAPVILTRNLPGNLHNGLIGEVIVAEKDKLTVNFEGKIVTLEKAKYEIYDPDEEKVLAVRYQYPVKLAFALTVHRAQGQTKKKVEIDCFSFFAAGQLGVAVGRAESSNGIRIINYNPTAARIQHPKSVYEFGLYRGVPFRDDLNCCRNAIPAEEQNPDNPNNPDKPDDQHGPDDDSSVNTDDIPTERGDADRPGTSDRRKYSHQDVDNFMREHSNVSFLPPTPISSELKDIFESHMNFLGVHIDKLLVKQPSGNDDFVTLYKKLNNFLTSETHNAVCNKLSQCPKAQKMSAKMGYWLVKQKIKELGETITKRQTERPQKSETGPLSASAKAKIRYIAGACIHKILTRLRGIVSRNIGKQQAMSKVKLSWNYRMHRLLTSLRISEEQVMKETKEKESIIEVQFRQGPSRGLVNISDEVFHFFVKLHEVSQNLVSNRSFHIGGESVHLVARGEILNSQALKTSWLELFDANGDDETFNSMLVELYELVTEHFLRISIVEGLQSFKASIPRKKKQALRSKVTALSERKEKVKQPQTSDEALFFCPTCNNECIEDPGRRDENSIGCDICNNWHHFKCVGLTGKEYFLNDQSTWKCPACQQRGKGKGKKSKKFTT